MASLDDAMESLRNAKKAATNAVDVLRSRMRDAEAAGDYELYDRCVDVLDAALVAEQKATKRLIAGILDPGDETAASLAEATKKLNKRIERLKADAAALIDVAKVLGAMTQIILSIAML